MGGSVCNMVWLLPHQFFFVKDVYKKEILEKFDGLFCSN